MSRASLTHHYDDPKEALIAPHKFMALTHYYVDRWLSELGERGHVIVTVLRRMGYLDRDRDVERGGIEIEQEDLAVLCGLKLRTLQREFANENGQPVNPALHRFVQREKQYHRNSAGRIVREKTVYVVQMKDPLHPSDEVAFGEERERREKNGAEVHSRRYAGQARQVAGYVYLLAAKGGVYKIGKTIALDSRVQQIVPKLPFECKLLHAIQSENHDALEAGFHRYFAAKRQNGEWFRLSKQDVQWFKSHASLTASEVAELFASQASSETTAIGSERD